MYQGRSLEAGKRTDWELGDKTLGFMRLWTTDFSCPGDCVNRRLPLVPQPGTIASFYTFCFVALA